MMLARTWGLLRSLAIYYGQVWRRGRLEAFYRQFLSPGSLAFDVGSHVGNRTWAWRNLNARVVAVEPQPDFFRLLQFIFDRDRDVMLENCGIGASAGTGRLWISSATPTVSSCTADWVNSAKETTSFSDVRWNQQIPMELRTLQQLIEQYGIPDFCKIDIEGGEEAALLGLRTPIRALSFECLAPMRERAFRCIDILCELGDYHFRYSKLETMRWSSPRWLDEEEIKNFIQRLSPSAPPGDIYAQLRSQSQGEEVMPVTR